MGFDVRSYTYVIFFNFVRVFNYIIGFIVKLSKEQKTPGMVTRCGKTIWSLTFG